MIRQEKRRLANGTVKTQVRVVQSYRPYPGKPPKHRTIKNFGYLEDQNDTEKFWKEVNACNDGLQGSTTKTIPIPDSNRIDLSVQRARNYGWRFVAKVYSKVTGDKAVGAELNETFMYLVADQFLYADSVREALARIPLYYGTETIDIDTKQFYQAVGICGESFYSAQKIISSRLQSMAGTDLMALLMQDPDCIKIPDGRRKAPPAMKIGLTLDPDHRCIGIAAFSTEDASDVLNTLAMAKQQAGVSRLILVTTGHVDGNAVCQRGDGFLTFRTCNGSESAKIRDLLQQPDGCSEFKKWRLINPSQVVLEPEDTSYRKQLVLETKSPDANSCDYILVATSESELQANEMVDLYDKLQNLDSSIRDIKSDYDSKIPFVNDPMRIKGYFLSLLTGLVIARLIQKSMAEERITIDRIRTALREANCIVLGKGGYVMLLDMAKSGCAGDYSLIQKCFGTDYYYEFAKQENFTRFFREMKLAI